MHKTDVSLGRRAFVGFIGCGYDHINCTLGFREGAALDDRVEGSQLRMLW